MFWITLRCENCFLQLHKLLEADPDDNIPVMAHSSKIKMKSFCNCGRKQAERDDPFDHRVGILRSAVVYWSRSWTLNP